MSRWAFCRTTLGLSEEEAWGITDREYMALVDAHDETEKAAWVRSAQVASILTKVHARKGSRGCEVRDLIPERYR